MSSPAATRSSPWPGRLLLLADPRRQRPGDGQQGALPLAPQARGPAQAPPLAAAGKLADLLVLEKNPLEDILNTTSLRWVMKGGRLYEADTLDELWPKEKAFGSFPW